MSKLATLALPTTTHPTITVVPKDLTTKRPQVPVFPYRLISLSIIVKNITPQLPNALSVSTKDPQVPTLVVIVMNSLTLLVTLSPLVSLALLSTVL